MSYSCDPPPVEQKGNDMQVQQLSLSDILAATPAQINPHFPSTTAEIEALCKRYHIWLPNFADYHSMTAYMFPRASRERLITLSILMDLLWFIDDYYTRSRLSPEQGDDQALAHTLMTGMSILLHDDAQEAYEGWHHVCRELRRQVLEQGGEGWLRRVVATLSEHLKATTFSISKSMENGKLSVERYIRVREHDSGMRVAIDAIEFAYGIELPPKVLSHPIILQLQGDCANVGGLINDVVSYHKEVEVGDHRFNLLNVLMEARGCDFPAAVHEAVQIINHFIRDFLTYEHAMPSFGSAALDEAVRLYVQGMKDQVGASLHWQLATNRYRAQQAPFSELRQVARV
jgi:hypothetical protein